MELKVWFSLANAIHSNEIHPFSAHQESENAVPSHKELFLVATDCQVEPQN